MVRWVKFDFDQILYVWIVFKIMIESIVYEKKIMIELKQVYE